MFMEIILICFLLLSIILNIFLCVSLFKSFRFTDQLESWVIDFKEEINSLYKKLKSIDERDMFEKDDDVGIIFQQIKDIISNTKTKIVDDEFIDDKKNQKSQV